MTDETKSFLSRYMSSIKNNPEGYWFKRRAYGWGWIPATWQGWLALAAFIAVFVWLLVSFVSEPAHAVGDLAPFELKIALWIAALFATCYLTGEPPRWQWGIPEEPHE